MNEEKAKALTALIGVALQKLIGEDAEFITVFASEKNDLMAAVGNVGQQKLISLAAGAFFDGLGLDGDDIEAVKAVIAELLEAKGD